MQGGSGCAQVNRVSEVVTSLADPSANVIFGAVIEDAYEGEVHVTIIATGFTQSFEDAILSGKTPVRERLTPQAPVHLPRCSDDRSRARGVLSRWRPQGVCTAPRLHAFCGVCFQRHGGMRISDRWRNTPQQQHAACHGSTTLSST